jgi:methanesulfonate monooxygenase large subunit
MAPRNHKQWKSVPNVEYISSECYNNNSIFQQEQELIFSKVWIPMCHISEMYEKGNYRTTQIAGQNVIAYNTGERTTM